jgi:hypothetical protein
MKVYTALGQFEHAHTRPGSGYGEGLALSRRELAARAGFLRPFTAAHRLRSIDPQIRAEREQDSSIQHASPQSAVGGLSEDPTFSLQELDFGSLVCQLCVLLRRENVGRRVGVPMARAAAVEIYLILFP